jgi:hypothetical protein
MLLTQRGNINMVYIVYEFDMGMTTARVILIETWNIGKYCIIGIQGESNYVCNN